MKRRATLEMTVMTAGLIMLYSGQSQMMKRNSTTYTAAKAAVEYAGGNTLFLAGAYSMMKKR